MDDLCEFTVTLDDRNPYLKRLSELRIKKCKVLHLMEPLPNDEFFKCPSRLGSLKILTEKVTPENLQILLKSTCPHLKTFCAVLPARTLTFSGYPSNFPSSFDCLRKLRLSLATIHDDAVILGPPPEFQDQLFKKIVECSMKHVKALAIEIRCLGGLQCSRLSGQVLGFIANHYDSLETIDFDLIQGHGVPSNFTEVRPLNQGDLEKIDVNKLKKCRDLRTVRIVNSTAVGVDLWLGLLANQRKLAFLETDILPAPNQVYKQIMLNNELTLVHVDIGDLTIDLDSENEHDRRFDCSVFQNCKQLRKLTLDRNTLKRRPLDMEFSAELINLHYLPEYLEELNINYFLILTDELLILFSSGKENFESLAMTQCGEFGDFGVDGTALEKILSLKNINFIEISPLNFTYPEEKLKLNQILTTFGYTENHSYFQLERRAQNFQIDFDDFAP